MFVLERRAITMFLLLSAVIASGTVSGQEEQWRIGFSQATTAESWRSLFNREMRAEAGKYPEIQLLIADGQDRTVKQVADMESFIRQSVDLILISPKESAGLTGVVEKAMSAGIPVIVLDRGVETENYTQYIGGDNRAIGMLAGQYVLELLGGAGEASGNIVEIWGGMGSTPAQQRHAGFVEALKDESGIRWVVNRQDGDWKQDKAYNIMSTALKANSKIDLVYAHNDPMAFGAYLAARDAGREDEILFIGIDGIPNEGAMWVKQGYLTATFMYPTPGEKAIQQAVKLLRGGKLEKILNLETRVIDAETVESYLREKTTN